MGIETNFYTRREAIKLIGAGIISTSSLGNEILRPGQISGLLLAKDPGIEAIKEEFILHLDKTGAFPNYTGFRNSEVLELPNGEHTCFCQATAWHRFRDGSIQIRPLADELSNEGFDKVLESGKLGVIVPPKAKEKELKNTKELDFELQAKKFKIPQATKELVNSIKNHLSPGLPTALPKKYGPFRITRFQNFAIQEDENNDTISPVLIGDAAKQLGLVPKEFGLNEAAIEDIEFIAKKKIPFGGDLDLLIKWTAQQMGISESHARRIIYCESKFNPRAQNQSGASGLWQIMPLHAPKFAKRGWDYWQDRFDPYKNSVVAIEIMQTSGLAAWSCK